MKKLIRALLIMQIFLGGCSALKEFMSFTKCEFRLQKLDRVELAGINILNKNSIDDFRLDELALITREAFKPTIYINFSVLLEVINPNTQLAALNKIEWIALIDDNEIVRGIVDHRYEIPPNNGITTIPLGFQLDLKQIASGKTGKSIAQLGMSLLNIGEVNSKLTLKIKPSVRIGSMWLDSSGYYSISKEFSSGR